MNGQSQSHNIKEMINQVAHEDPAAVAIISSKHKPLSYAQLAGQIDHVAAALSKAGLKNSSRLAIAVKDAAPAALAIVTVACFAAAVPLDQNLAAAEIEMRLKLLNVDAVCMPAGEDNITRSVAKKHGIPIIELISQDKQELPFSMSVPEIPNIILRDHDPSDNVAIILQTSGTTAEPKLAPCLHSALLTSAQRTRMWFDLTKNDRCLNIAPPYYSHGLTFTILAPLLSGGSVAFPSSPNDVNVVEWFETLRPTWYSASPTMHLAISEKLSLMPSGPDHRLRFAGSGGAPLLENVRSNLQRMLGIPVLEHYGMTEANQVSTNLPPPGPCKAGTVGIPPRDTVMIAGDDSLGLPPNRKGEIWIRGQNVIMGYLNGPELNQAAFSNGWFRTGDIGILDDDGFLTILDRIKELINRGSEKISPFEIEAVILKHPDVLEAVAYAIPHPRLGEDVAAAVVLRPGTTLDIVEMRRFMSAHLSWNKIPRRIHVMETIPKGLGGKALRRKLSELYS